jgi:hypothetical protein
MIAPQCDPTDPTIKCAGRNDASRRGDFFFDFSRWVWVWVPMRDHEGVRGPWRECPWCRHLLPSADDMANHLLLAAYAEDE